jgi:hypothetical protein
VRERIRERKTRKKNEKEREMTREGESQRETFFYLLKYWIGKLECYPMMKP